MLATRNTQVDDSTGNWTKVRARVKGANMQPKESCIT
jgi:hypothetical protein